MVAATRQEPLPRHKEKHHHHVKGGWRNERPLRDLLEGMKSSSIMRNEDDKTKYYSLKNLFGCLKKQKKIETTTAAYGAKVKKIIETKIPFADSANFEAKESENFKTHQPSE